MESSLPDENLPGVSPYDFTGCQAAADWEAVHGHVTLAQAIILQRLVKSLPPKCAVAELGCYQGKSTVAMAAVLPPGGRLYSVDTFLGTVLRPGEERKPSSLIRRENMDALHANLLRFNVLDKVTVIAGSTRQASEKFPDNSLHMLFIDAGHEYESISDDLARWLPKLSVNGWLVCDDYGAAFPGVDRAIHETGLQGHQPCKGFWAHRKGE